MRRKSKTTTRKTSVSGGDATVINLFDKFEKKVEKQLAGFVKEIVRLKKAQEQLHKQVTPTRGTKTKQSRSTSTKGAKKRVQKTKKLRTAA